MACTNYQLTVDVRDQLTVAQASWHAQPMVDSQMFRELFAYRLNLALDQMLGIRKGRGRNVDLQALLKRNGVPTTTQATSKWLRGETLPDKPKIQALAKLLEVRAEWLEYGDGSMRSADFAFDTALQAPATAENVARYSTIEASRLYRYPVLSAVAAGAFADALQPYEPGAEPDAELTDYKAKGEAFWLVVDGDSMTWTGSPSIPAGHLILVDTGIEPKPGQLVVAKLVSESAATFKKLISDGGRLFLKPLNPDPIYRTVEVDANCRIIGVVKEAKLKL